MKIEVIDSYEGQEQLHREWDELEARGNVPGVFLTWDWQSIWWRYFGAGASNRVVLMRDDGGKLRGLVPLYIFRGEPSDNETDRQPSGNGGKRIMRIGGGVDVSDYLDILSAPEDAPAVWDAFGRFLRDCANEWDIFDLHSIPQNSATRTLARDWAASVGYSYTEQVDEVCPVIDLPAQGDIEAWLTEMGKKNRHELRRKIRRFEEQFPDYKYYTSDCDDCKDGLEDFYALHRASDGNKQKFMDEKMARFFSEMVDALTDHSWIRLSFLEVGGKRVASYLSFDYNNRIYLYNSGYNPEYRDYSVGIVLLAYYIKEAIRTGHTRFDFLRGNERYKYALGATDTEVFNIQIARAGDGAQ
jgi:CelD/BcsL family acetyltransferase involved in cellulose biosynthesis